MVSCSRYRRSMVLSVFLIIIVGILALSNRSEHAPAVALLQDQYPLLWDRVHTFNGQGGAWYLPPTWSQPLTRPRNILEAARVAVHASNFTDPDRHIAHSNIPLIVHQTWGTRHIDTWSEGLRRSTEKWLQYVVDGNMAYFLWEDDGMLQLIDNCAPEFHGPYSSLASMVEKTDVFRIIVAKCIGGIYGDLDAEPLKSPDKWIVPEDILPWMDPETGVLYNSTKPVGAIFGIEADCPPDGDTCWRMGYANSVQLTQWSFASRREHPLLREYLNKFMDELQTIASQSGETLESQAAQAKLQALDPLTLTGPEAVTRAAQNWLEGLAGLRWNALTGLQDGGKSKVVDDVLILPITGFSPGRGRYGNMGSKPTTDPTARLVHHAQGSWKKFDLVVEFGKFCRTFLGLCENWSKVPHQT
ncbi:hypothetical protein BDV25DRAFT_160051 [Aspergillus avenaceus]|uniref:Glycosyl transferase n=1 Tax=Aspergillus avenaceus TaxID=36643 RepID=A0A5N6TMU3_ASPAV|nr:hypothetical protein BDV25DRAFT_160051 [Aspergillus avenaceus]